MPTVQNSYFPFFFHYNTYVIGILCAYLIRNEIKPKIMVSEFFRLRLKLYLTFLKTNSEPILTQNLIQAH